MAEVKRSERYHLIALERKGANESVTRKRLQLEREVKLFDVTEKEKTKMSRGIQALNQRPYNTNKLLVGIHDSYFRWADLQRALGNGL